MKKFLLGLAVGAVAVYTASKLIDEETKEEFYDNLEAGRKKAFRKGIRFKRNFMDGKERATQAAGEFVDKVSENLHELQGKVKESIHKTTN